MILIYQGENDKYQFEENENNERKLIIDLNKIEQQLDEGLQEQLLKIFEQVISSEEYIATDNQVKSQVEWAYSLVKSYQNNNEQQQPELYDQLNNELINQRYPEVHQTNKLLDDNLSKIRARVQLLQLTEQRNMLKVFNYIIQTKSLERNTQRIIISKQNKFEKETKKDRFARLQREQIEKRKKEIQKQREVHLQIIEQSKGRQGKIVQERILQTREFRVRIQQDFHQTMRQVEVENQKSYQRVKKMEQSQSERIQKFLLDKQVVAQKNYQKKVEDEFYCTMNKQDELESLEKLEQHLLERIKVTQQMYQESSLRLETIKQQSYRIIGQQQI